MFERPSIVTVGFDKTIPSPLRVIQLNTCSDITMTLMESLMPCELEARYTPDAVKRCQDKS